MLELKDIIYLDNNATTPVDLRVLAAMKPYFTEYFGNASSMDHMHGGRAAEDVAYARAKIAGAIGAREGDLVFTGGATESNNLAISGVMKAYEDAGDHMITCLTEHESVLSVARHMERAGKRVTYLPVDQLGHIDMSELRDAITDDTILISVMTANNEIGTIQDIESIGGIARENGVLFHTDAAQAVGHIPIDVDKMNIDLMSFSAHKMYGPKGIGALYVRGVHPRVKLEPIIHGGGQERGMRPGTLNVPAIMGFGKAISIASTEMYSENIELRKQSMNMLRILEESAGALLNGDPSNRLAGNLNLCFPGIEGKAIINSVSKSISISAGSACTTQSVEPSHVIMALGFGEERAHSSIRIGIGRFTEEGGEESEFAAWEISDAVTKLGKING